MKGTFIHYQELGFMLSGNVLKRQPSFNLNLHQLWKWLIYQVLSADNLRIYTSKDRSGERYWTAYDRLTGQRAIFNSEAEVREWIDRRYSDTNSI